MTEVQVSILCIAYNHEPFIRKALDGFLMQKTRYSYEILVHDDASTDSTANIIREYAARHPDQIFPVFQSRNQYSKGVAVNYEFNFRRARGKYIALCEGDDYWTDENKLERQVQYLESHPGCTFTFHNAEVIGLHGDTMRPFFSRAWNSFNGYEPGDRDFDADALIRFGFLPTASIVYRKECMDDAPPFYFNGVCGDLPTYLICVSQGSAHFFDREMSAYRQGNPHSATAVQVSSRLELEKYIGGVQKIYRDFDAWTGGRYHKACEQKILEKSFEKLFYQQDYRGMRGPEYAEIIKKVTPLQKGIFWTKVHMGDQYALLRGMAYRLQALRRTLGT